MPMEMQNQVMGYDRTATMFSPDGHLLQVEYAEKTVRLGSSSIGFVCKDGVVIVADKRIKDRLITAESTHKVNEVDDHMIMATAGILSDSRVLIEKAQLIAQQNRITYDGPVDVETVIKEIANMKQAFTQYGGARPFGASVMIAGLSGIHPKLFVSDITGNYFSYHTTAIGENDEKIKEMLRKDYKEDMVIDDAIKLGLKIFKSIQGKNFDMDRFDVAYVNLEEKKLKRLLGDLLKKYK
ncbi:MAG: archaeal proteasome endopeptidase complex subunit alpha [Nanoarchaeota archaeon]|nr:archaeal proteasome endopeptidase complex subunit alpha [Nanoarchaeota archaeon]